MLFQLKINIINVAEKITRHYLLTANNHLAKEVIYFIIKKHSRDITGDDFITAQVQVQLITLDKEFHIPAEKECEKLMEASKQPRYSMQVNNTRLDIWKISTNLNNELFQKPFIMMMVTTDTEQLFGCFFFHGVN